MKNKEFKRNCKFAGTTLEVALSIGLGVVVLFVVLGIFGDNLKTMVSSSNINNLTKQSNQKTSYESYNRNYASSNAQVGVKYVPTQTIAEQGLEIAMAAAQATIDRYKDRDPASLSPSETENLAKALTKYAIGVGTRSNVNEPTSGKFGINIDFTNGMDPNSGIPCGQTTVDGKSIYYPLIVNTTNKLSAIKAVDAAKFIN